MAIATAATAAAAPTPRRGRTTPASGEKVPSAQNPVSLSAFWLALNTLLSSITAKKLPFVAPPTSTKIQIT
jgi:hypothetical protein